MRDERVAITDAFVVVFVLVVAVAIQEPPAGDFAPLLQQFQLPG